jgi:hypothetical protein
LCHEKDSADNVFYLHDFPHGLEFLQRILGIILVQWRVDDTGGYGVEADAFFCVLDCETPDHCIQALLVIIQTEAFTPATG